MHIIQEPVLFGSPHRCNPRVSSITAELAATSTKKLSAVATVQVVKASPAKPIPRLIQKPRVDMN